MIVVAANLFVPWSDTLLSYVVAAEDRWDNLELHQTPCTAVHMMESEPLYMFVYPEV